MVALRAEGIVPYVRDSPGFVGFAGQRVCGQRSIAADLTFWLLLGQAKSNSPAAIERQEPYTIRANRYAHAVSIGKSEICKVRGCFGIAKPLARQFPACRQAG